MRIATLTHEVLQPARYVKQMSSLDCVAMFTLRLTPVPGIRGVRFGNEVCKPELESWIIGAVERGVMEFVSERDQEHKPVGCLAVTLVDIDIHPVDSRETGFMLAAYFAMKQAFQAHESVVDFELEKKYET